MAFAALSAYEMSTPMPKLSSRSTLNCSARLVADRPGVVELVSYDEVVATVKKDPWDASHEAIEAVFASAGDDGPEVRAVRRQNGNLYVEIGPEESGISFSIRSRSKSEWAISLLLVEAQVKRLELTVDEASRRNGFPVAGGAIDAMFVGIRSIRFTALRPSVMQETSDDPSVLYWLTGFVDYVKGKLYTRSMSASDGGEDREMSVDERAWYLAAVREVISMLPEWADLPFHEEGREHDGEIRVKTPVRFLNPGQHFIFDPSNTSQVLVAGEEGAYVIPPTTRRESRMEVGEMLLIGSKLVIKSEPHPQDGAYMTASFDLHDEVLVYTRDDD